MAFVPDSFELLPDGALASVVGGAGMNVDSSKTRWRFVQVGEVPVPIPITTTKQERTPFGACVDRATATRPDPDSRLAEIHRCWQTRNQNQETP